MGVVGKEGVGLGEEAAAAIRCRAGGRTGRAVHDAEPGLDLGGVISAGSAVLRPGKRSAGVQAWRGPRGGRSSRDDLSSSFPLSRTWLLISVDFSSPNSSGERASGNRGLANRQVACKGPGTGQGVQYVVYLAGEQGGGRRGRGRGGGSSSCS